SIGRHSRDRSPPLAVSRRRGLGTFSWYLEAHGACVAMSGLGTFGPRRCPTQAAMLQATRARSERSSLLPRRPHPFHFAVVALALAGLSRLGQPLAVQCVRLRRSEAVEDFGGESAQMIPGLPRIFRPIGSGMRSDEARRL